MSERARSVVAEIASRQVAAIEQRRTEIVAVADIAQHFHDGAERVRKASLERHPEDTAEIRLARLLAVVAEADQVTRTKQRGSQQRRRAAA